MMVRQLHTRTSYISSQTDTYRHREDFNYSTYCLAYTHLPFHILNRTIRIISMPSEVPKQKQCVTDLDEDNQNRQVANLKMKHQSYLAKSTIRTARATESPTIPMKVAIPFNRTCTRTMNVCQLVTHAELAPQDQNLILWYACHIGGVGGRIKPEEVSLHPNLQICLPLTIPIQCLFQQLLPGHYNSTSVDRCSNFLINASD